LSANLISDGWVNGHPAYDKSLSKLRDFLSEKSLVSEQIVLEAYPEDWPRIQKCSRQTLSFKSIRGLYLDSQDRAFDVSKAYVGNSRGKTSNSDAYEKEMSDRFAELMTRSQGYKREYKAFIQKNAQDISEINRLYNTSEKIYKKIGISNS